MKMRKRYGYEKHGCGATGRKPPEYNSWVAMKQRCLNPNDCKYARYGGRGVTVCTEWVFSFTAFLNAVGRMPASGMTLERIDNDRGYEPGNVRWATRAEQSLNRCVTNFLTLNGETKPLLTWANERGLKVTTIRARIRRGWTVEETLNPKKRKPWGRP